MIPDPIIHIRHGETAWNFARRLQGAKDIPLNDTGRAQAARNGRALKTLIADIGAEPQAFDWVCSPMHRSRETMEIVRREIGLDPAGYRIDTGLRELSFGRLEGMTYEEMEAEEPDLYARLRQDKWTFQPPGGESYVTLTERVAAALATVASPGIVVAHGGVFRALLSLVRGYHDQEMADFLVPQDRFFVARGGIEDWV
jgi:probable phosphoglycerate mutase